MKTFVAFLAMVAVVAAVKDPHAEQKYDIEEVEYQHYEPQQQQVHQQAPSSGYRHQPAAAVVHHQAASNSHEQKHYKHIPILKSEMYTDKDGSYKYGFEAGNGIHQQEHGYVKNAGQKDHEIQVAEGFYSYVDEHGHQIGVHYIADENGFRATGDHLPTPPPLPEALREAYAKVAANPELYKEEEEAPEQTYEHVAYHQAAASAPQQSHQQHHRYQVPQPSVHEEYQTESHDYKQ